MAIMKNVTKNSESWKAGGIIGIYEPVKLGASDGEVIIPTADDDLIIGVSLIDAVAGESVGVVSEGVVLMRIGATPPAVNDLVGLDATDPTEITTFNTLNNSQVVGICVSTGAENEYAKIKLFMDNKTA